MDVVAWIWLWVFSSVPFTLVSVLCQNYGICFTIVMAKTLLFPSSGRWWMQTREFTRCWESVSDGWALSLLQDICIIIPMTQGTLQQRWNNVRTRARRKAKNGHLGETKPLQAGPHRSCKAYTESTYDCVCQQTGRDGELGGLPLTAGIFVTDRFQGRRNYWPPLCSH